MSPEQNGDLRLNSDRERRLAAWEPRCYCLLAGARARGRRRWCSAVQVRCNGATYRPQQLDPRIDQALEAICQKAMALKPEDRFPLARGLAEDVERWMADEPVSCWREPVGRRCRAMGGGTAARWWPGRRCSFGVGTVVATYPPARC